MTRIPTVAIIGRPNTGKSTLFNRMIGEQRAIVSPIAGTTRDHVATRVEGEAVDYLLIDTGGIGGGSEDHELEDNVAEQSLIALEHADLILFTINAREEITAADHAVTDILRKKRKRHVPIILIATKCDTFKIAEENVAMLHELGIGDDVVAVSGAQGIGMRELRNSIEEQLQKLHFQKDAPKEKDISVPRIAIVGKPNVGKSSLINALMSDPQRETSPRIVSPIPGTTRDVSDTVIRHDGKDYIFLDTAGLRRQARVAEDIEHASALRSIRAIGDADIVVLLVDASEPISQQDKRLARMAVDEGRALIILTNKMDLVPSAEQHLRVKEIQRDLHFCTFAPILGVSTITRENLPKLFPLFSQVQENLHRRIATKNLRQWFQTAQQRLPANALSRSKHMTQAEEVPPTFVIFVSKPRDVQRAHLKFLETSLRTLFAFEGVPIRFIVKEK